ncbi:MAG: hypothetical protein IK025_00775 [Bacteroidales bacterium]|nr:hypothetical protein [Bacteroidales bacterium]
MKNLHYILFAILLSAVVCSCKSKYAEPTADENDAKSEEVAADSIPESDTTAVEETAFELEMKTYRVVKSAKGCSFTYHAVLPADTDNKAILAIRDDVLGEISNGVDVTADFKRSAANSVRMYQEAVADSTDEYFEYFEEYDLDSIYPVFVAEGFIAMAYFAFYEVSTAPRTAMEYHYKMYDLATGKRMTEKDIFCDTRKAKNLIEKYIWEQTEPWQNGDEDDASQITNEEVFNGNYYVSEDKFFVCYNSSVYFIPGGIDIEIPKEALKPYLKQDGLIYRYWFGEE